MQVLFVHGMGRTPISGTPMLWRLRRHGHDVDVFGYLATTENFADIVQRLETKLRQLAGDGEYVLVGHSLGGVLLRAALSQCSELIRPPKHLFLLGSPISPPRLASKSRRELGFQLFAGDCGQLLASNQRLSQIPMPSIPITIVVGTRGFAPTKKYFLEEINDGVVSLSEISYPQINDVKHVPVIHTFLPSSRKVTQIILNKIARLQISL